MAQQPMTPFWPIFPSKSDGQHIVNMKGRPLRNGPTEEQLNMSPNDQGQRDFYRLIEKDDPKHQDWRKKLGGMLLRELGGKQYEDKWQQCILWEFPENYVLYEHIKTKADGQVKTVKNHSGGGHDRQDAYLYGYPKGPKKRFRSPVEFFPHLLWLCTDENSDMINCTCKMCSPAGDVEKPQVKVEVKQEAPPIKREISSGGATGNNVNAVVRNQTVQPPIRRPSTGPPIPSPISKPATPAPVPVATPAAQQIRAPPVLQSTPLPQPRSLEQQVDLTYNRFLCRTGEAVWFFRPETAAWGLGLVIRRWSTKANPADRSYQIQPLSHPFEAPPTETVQSDAHVKPWLAWSAPACTFPFLQQNPQYEYGNTDWKALIDGQGGKGIASVDASILAAKAIDATYTLFEPLKTSKDDKGNQYRQYNGMFLGAEKIWRGEAVRLRVGSGTDLLVITDIIEQSLVNQTNTKVIIVGDLYGYALLEAPDPNLPPKPPQQNNNIPSRMVQDMLWRNRILVPKTRSAAWWKLLQPSYKVEINEVKGRWYETSLLFQQSFMDAVENNEGGNGIWMNSRGEATGKACISQPDRIAAFGASIPPTTHLIEGMDPPSESITQPQQLHNSMGIPMNNGLVDPASFSIDDFMHVDHLGDDTGMEYNGNNHFTY
ncbi:Clr2 domain containing protein [Pyrenophora tritici-repentis]|uniref:Clr2 domain containing protein n=2 Tax=Pyrenophora tritici-repentis TaxID=45151 RepID=A0A2W1HKC8_9PLEO|nr:uncharacterized protein PTRG_09111 [Pyrenophora tritici-repentis Pt-1C-BFP]KAA8627701.1 Clr2 domain-containing protein [Pyrenophora tritici-repentis]EDU42162.1 predicted protein [Pyrenophora tritici-repentis Pt-1C-BFP]KAF7442268.1 Clr2 domain containing protein [Pyrenophora tritici-repentis]KAF7579360.1 Clr2 domain containing protein [Pyrenophora tritici-repentis]KAG9378281.1 Clr2 domain containing protein [Pyrenophora tritici-repentis]